VPLYAWANPIPYPGGRSLWDFSALCLRFQPGVRGPFVFDGMGTSDQPCRMYASIDAGCGCTVCNAVIYWGCWRLRLLTLRSWKALLLGPVVHKTTGFFIAPLFVFCMEQFFKRNLWVTACIVAQL